VSGERSPDPRRRALIVFGLALIAYVGIALASGQNLRSASQNNHFSHQAAAWLDGRLALDGVPPGFCTPEARRAKECRQHTFDDWAVVWTLELDDGRTVRGYPCKRQACREARRSRSGETWRLIGGEERTFARGEIQARSRTWYVSFPPGPAALMVPLVAALGLDAPDRLITALLGALTIALFIWFLDARRGVRQEHWIAAAALGLAGPMPLLAAHGSVWFTAQVMACAGLVAFLHLAWDSRRPALAGLALAIACSARPHVAIAVLFFLGTWWRSSERSWSTLMRFAAPLVTVALVLAWMNVERFGHPFEFGHRFLEIRWQTRIQETGLFALDYVPRNLRCLLTLLPVAAPTAPFFQVSIHGSAIWIGAPWLGFTATARERFERRPELWLTTLGIALVPLAYQNSGQLQSTYRFAAEWLPFALTAIVFGGIASQKRWFAAVVAVGALFSLVTATLHGADPGRLYVTDPLGWPFEAELR
jgi:hypothetical protein